jgi:hypothetical protein
VRLSPNETLASGRGSNPAFTKPKHRLAATRAAG